MSYTTREPKSRMLFEGAIPEFVWRDLVKPRKISVRTGGRIVKIRG
jgi:hypothetical protein